MRHHYLQYIPQGKTADSISITGSSYCDKSTNASYIETSLTFPQHAFFFINMNDQCNMIKYTEIYKATWCPWQCWFITYIHCYVKFTWYNYKDKTYRHIEKQALNFQHVILFTLFVTIKNCLSITNEQNVGWQYLNHHSVCKEIWNPLM